MYLLPLVTLLLPQPPTSSCSSMSSTLPDSFEGGEQKVVNFNWEELPEDMKVDILGRLPDKMLIRLKCVAKSWYLLISQVAAPMISSPSPSAVFCGVFFTYLIVKESCRYLRFRADEELFKSMTSQLINRNFWRLPYKPRAEDFQDCCNGLFLMARFDSVPTEYHICNPTTYECIPIPINPDHVVGDSDPSHFSGLAFDPTDSITSFRIIRMGNGPVSNNTLKLDVFSSNPGKWVSQVVPLDPVFEGFGWVDRFIYLNGILYVMSLAKYLLCIYMIRDEKENTTKIFAPAAIELPGMDKFNVCGSFGVSRGSLMYANADESNILIWSLKAGFRHWVLEHTINIGDLITHVRTSFLLGHLRHEEACVKVYGFHPKSEVIFVGSHHLMYAFNPRTKEVTFYNQFSGERVICGGQHRVFPYSRCALLLNSVIRKS